MNRQINTGMTLIEVMVVVAIIGIIVAIAAPSFSAMLEKQRIKGAAEAVLADLRWARAEAIKRNERVRVTFTSGSHWSYTIDTVPALAASNTSCPKRSTAATFLQLPYQHSLFPVRCLYHL